MTTTNTARSDYEPLVVDPTGGCVLLRCGLDKLYKLLSSGEIDSYLDGRSRRIPVASIKAYIERRIAASRDFKPASNNPHANSKRRRDGDEAEGRVA
jgi:excisionase family DNA binding protein